MDWWSYKWYICIVGIVGCIVVIGSWYGDMVVGCWLKDRWMLDIKWMFSDDGFCDVFRVVWIMGSGMFVG